MRSRYLAFVVVQRPTFWQQRSIAHLFIQLGYDKTNLMPCHNQSFQYLHRKLRYSCMVETNSKDAVSPVRIVEAVDTGFPSISHR